MKLFVTGATGLIGRRLITDRIRRGDDLVVLTRDAARARADFGEEADRLRIVEGDAMNAGLWQDEVDGCGAVVHLAGAGVADKRWTRAYKQLIVDSRIESTRQVVVAIAAARQRPPVLVNASAIGWYGECGETPVDEDAPVGDDFLAELSVKWEGEARRAAEGDTRVAMLRMGLVLDARGGTLGGLLPIFRLGLGGPIGNGRQYMSWIHWRDVVGLIDLVLTETRASGPINAVAPNAVTNRAFSRALGRALRRPAFLPMPVFALRIAIGELGEYAAMSQRVVPQRAADLGYDFVYPDLHAALDDLVHAGG